MKHRQVSPLIAGGVQLVLAALLAAGGTALAGSRGGSIVVDHQPDGVELRSGRLIVRVNHVPWRLEVRDTVRATGGLAEYPAERNAAGASVGSLGVHVSSPGERRPIRWQRVTSVLGMTVDIDTVRFRAGTDDPDGRELDIEVRFPSPRAVNLRVTPRPADDVQAIADGFVTERNEALFGLGARFGPLDARGSDIRVMVQPRPDTLDPRGTHLPVPFLLSSRAYGLVVLGTEEAVFHLNTVRPDAVIVKALARQLHFTVLVGDSPLDVAADHARLTGPPALPPPWAFGVWKTVIGGEARVLEEVKRLRRDAIPVSVLWSYDMRDEATNLGWSPWVHRSIAAGEYPDVADLVRRLQKKGYRVLGYLSPEFRVDAPLFGKGRLEGYFVRNRIGEPHLIDGMQGAPAALLDFTRPDAVRWWRTLLGRVLGELGFDGAMLDGGDAAPEDGAYASGITGAPARNTYPLLYARSSRAAMLDAKPDSTAFMRAGFAGSHAVTPIAWPADQSFSWDERTGLPAAVRATLNGSISGFAVWAPDIGGYYGCRDSLGFDEELWIRWVQVGALQPIMRDHLGDKCAEATGLSSSAATLGAFRRFAELHRRLAPHLYRLARESAETGRPVMRPVALVAAGDTRARHDEFTYLLGDDILVAPVVVPGATRRLVFLPPGEWVDWWDGLRYRGPDQVTVPAPRERIPLFVRPGPGTPIGSAREVGRHPRWFDLGHPRRGG